MTRAAGNPRPAARSTAARAPWLAFDAFPGDSPGTPLGWSVQERSRNDDEEEEAEEPAVPPPNSATSSAALAAAPPSPASIATVRDVLTAALIVWGLAPEPDALGQAPPCVAAALTAAAAAWGVGCGEEEGGGAVAAAAAASPVLLEDALFLVRRVPGQAVLGEVL